MSIMDNSNENQTKGKLIVQSEGKKEVRSAKVLQNKIFINEEELADLHFPTQYNANNNDIKSYMVSDYQSKSDDNTDANLICEDLIKIKKSKHHNKAGIGSNHSAKISEIKMKLKTVKKGTIKKNSDQQISKNMLRLKDSSKILQISPEKGNFIPVEKGIKLNLNQSTITKTLSSQPKNGFIPKRRQVRDSKYSQSTKLDFLGRELIKKVSVLLNQKRETATCLKENLKQLKKKMTFNNRHSLDKELVIQNTAGKSLFSEVQQNNDKTTKSSNKLLEKDINFQRIHMSKPTKSIKLLKKFKVIYEVNLSEEEEDQVIESIISPYLINQESWQKKGWDFVIFLMALYTIVFSPIYLSFYNNSALFKGIEKVFEIFFILDLLLNFLTSYKTEDSEEKTVTSLKQITEKYLFSWFLFDLLTSIPFEFILTETSRATVLSFLKWLNVLRVFKLVNTKTTGRFFEPIVLNENQTLNRVLKFLFIFLIMIHINSCFFIFLGYASVSQDNWINKAGFENDESFVIYISSVYFNVVTISSVGYGDILPSSILEKVFMVIFMFAGSFTFSYGVSSLSTMFSSKNAKYLEYKRKMEVLDSIYNEFTLNEVLHLKLKRNINLDFKKNDNDCFLLLESLPTNVKNDLSIVMYKAQIQKHKFFQHQPNDFILYVLPLLKNHNILKGDTLISTGEIIEEMYLILNGFLSIQLSVLYDYIEIGLIGENNYFGELLMHLNEQSPFELKCKSKKAEILVLKKPDFLKIKNSFRLNIFDILEESYNYLQLLERRKQAYINLFQFYQSADTVKKRLRQLNIFLMKQGFDQWFESEIEFKDANDFIVNSDIASIKALLDRIEEKREKTSKPPNRIRTTTKTCYKSTQTQITENGDQNSNALVNNIRVNQDTKTMKIEKRLGELFQYFYDKSCLQKDKINNEATHCSKTQDEEDGNFENNKPDFIRSSSDIQGTSLKTQLNTTNNINFISLRNKRLNKRKSMTQDLKKQFSVVYDKINKNFDNTFNKEMLDRESMLNEKTLNLINKNKETNARKSLKMKRQSSKINPDEFLSKSIDEINLTTNKNKLCVSCNGCFNVNKLNAAPAGNVFVIEKTVDLFICEKIEQKDEITRNVVINAGSSFTHLSVIPLEEFTITSKVVRTFNTHSTDKLRGTNKIFNNVSVDENEKKLSGSNQQTKYFLKFHQENAKFRPKPYFVSKETVSPFENDEKHLKKLDYFFQCLDKYKNKDKCANKDKIYNDSPELLVLKNVDS